MPDTNEQYMSLITSEHCNKPLYNEYVRTFLDMISPTVDVLNEFNVLFQLDTAVGDQLDILGNLVGISRILPVYNEYIDPVLTDETYRKVILAKIYKNRWNGTIEGLYEIINSVLPEIRFDIVDNQDMSNIVVLFDTTISDQDFALLQLGYILPKPSGVGVNYYIEQDLLFGFDSDTDIIKGWDEGYWASR